MDLRKRFFGLAADRDSRGTVQTYLDEVLDRLLLFDTFILDSIRLREIPALLSAFGYNDLNALIQDPAFEIHCDAIFIAYQPEQVGVTEISSGVIKIGPIHFGVGKINREHMLTQAYAEFDRLPIDQRQRDDLKAAVARKIHPRAPESGEVAFAQLQRDLDLNAPNIRIAVSTILAARLGVDVDAALVDVKFDRDNRGAHQAITSLPKVFGISPKDAADVIGSAALATGSLAQNVEKMRRFTCIVGGREREQSIFDEKLAFLTTALDATLQVNRMHRVLEMLDLPRLDPARIDLRRFLEVRNTRECKEFRDWLWGIDSLDDTDVTERIRDLRSKLGTWVRTDQAKVIRWAVGTGIGFIPILGGALGATVSALDAFLIERVLPESGVVTFLGQQYPSLFRD